MADKEIMRGQVRLDLETLKADGAALKDELNRIAQGASGVFRDVGQAADQNLTNALKPLASIAASLEQVRQQLASFATAYKQAGQQQVQTAQETAAQVVKVDQQTAQQREKNLLAWNEQARKLVKDGADAQLKELKIQSDAALAQDKLASQQTIAARQAQAKENIALIQAMGTDEVAQRRATAQQVVAVIKANAQQEVAERKAGAQENVATIKAASQEEIAAQRISSQETVAFARLASQEYLAEKKQAFAEALALAKQEHAAEIADARLELQERKVILQEETAARRQAAQESAAAARGSGAGAASALPQADTAAEMRALADETATANDRLAETEQRVYAVYRAGAQIAQLSFMFSMFGSAVMGIFTKVIGAAEDFDTWSRKAAAAAATTGQFGLTVQQVQQQLLDLSKQIGSFDPAQIAQAYYYWQSATGEVIGSQQQLSDVLNKELLPVLQAAALAQVDTQTAIRGVSQAVAEFGLSTDQAAHAAQVMLATGQLTNAEFSDMIESFKMVGPAAAAMGISLDEAAAMMGELAQNGVRGSQAGRGLQQLMLGLVDPSKKATAELDNIFAASDKVGVSWQQILFPGGQFVGMLDKLNADGSTSEGMIHLLADRLRQLSPAQQQAALAALTTSNSYRVLLPLVEDYLKNTDAAKTATQQLYNQLKENPAALFSDQLQTYAAGIKEQFGQRINDLKSALIDLGLVAEHALIPVLDALVRLVDLLKQVGQAHPVLIELAMRAAALAVVFGTLAAGAGVVIGNITQLVAALQLVGPALQAIVAEGAGLMLTVAPLFVPLMAAVAAFALAWINDWDGIRTAIVGLKAELQDLLDHARQIFVDLLSVSSDFLHLNWADLGAKLQDAFVQALAAVLQIAAQVGPALLGLFQDLLTEVDQVLTRWFGTAYTTGRDWAAQITQGLRDGLLGEIQHIVDQANTLIGGIGRLTGQPATPTVPLTGRAFGGYVQPGEVTLLGEDGPELVVLPPGSQVIPNHVSKGILARGMAAGSAPTLTAIPATSATVSTSTPTPDPGPLLQWALQMGAAVGDNFIQGFTSADFGQLESLLDDVMKNLDNDLKNGVFGQGSQAVDVFVAKYTTAIDTIQQIIQLAKQGVTAIPSTLSGQLSDVAGDLAPDIQRTAQAYGTVQHDQGAVNADQTKVAGLQHQKDLIDDQKAGEQAIIDSLNRQKEPYQDQIAAIDRVIEGLNRQKRALDILKEPLEDAKNQIADTVTGLQHQLEPINDAKQALELQKEPLADEKQRLQDIVSTLEDQKQALEDQKAPWQDLKDQQQDVLKNLNDQLQTLRDTLQDQKDKQQAAVDAVQATIDAQKDALDQDKQAEADRHQAVQDRLDAEQAALDLAKQNAQDQQAAAQAQITADQQALDLTKARFAAEEQIAAARVEQAGLLGASKNVTDFLKYQEAALKQAHQNALTPAEQQLKNEQDALKAKKAASDAELAARDRHLKAEIAAEKNKQDQAKRAFDQRDRQLQQESRNLKLQEDQNKADNAILDKQIKSKEQDVKNQQKAIENTDKQITAIDRQEKLVDRQEAFFQKQIKDRDRQLELIQRQETYQDRLAAGINRQIELENRKKSYLDDQETQIARQQTLLDRQIARQNDLKNAPNDAIQALDDQAKPHQRRLEDLDLQAKAEDKLLKQAQDQQKLDEQALKNDQQKLADAAALLAWHQKIHDLAQQARDDLKTGAGGLPGKGDQGATGPAFDKRPGEGFVEGDVTKQPTSGDLATILAGALWDEYAARAKAALDQVNLDLGNHVGQVAGHLGMVTSLSARTADEVGATVLTRVTKWRTAIDDFIGGATNVPIADAKQQQAYLKAYMEAIDAGLDPGPWQPLVEKSYTRRREVFGPDGKRIGELGKWEQDWRLTLKDLGQAMYDGYVDMIGGLAQKTKGKLSDIFDFKAAAGPDSGLGDLTHGLDTLGEGLDRVATKGAGVKGLFDVPAGEAERILAVNQRGAGVVPPISDIRPLKGTPEILPGLEEAVTRPPVADFPKVNLADLKETRQGLLDFNGSIRDLMNSYKSLGEQWPATKEVFTQTHLAIQGPGEDMLHLGKIAESVPNDFAKVSHAGLDLGKGLEFLTKGDELLKGASALAKLVDLGEGLLKIGEVAAGGSGPFGWPLIVLIDLVTTIAEHWHTFYGHVKDSLAFLTQVFTAKVIPVFNQFIAGTMERLGPAITNIMKVLGVVDVVIQALILTIGRFVEKLGPVLGPVIKFVVDDLLIFVDILKNLWFIILDLLGGNWSKLGQDIKNLFGDTLKHLGDMLVDLVQVAKNFIPAVWAGIKNAAAFLGPALGKLFGAIGDQIGKFFDLLGTRWHTILTDLKNDPAKVLGGLKDAIGKALSGIIDAICDPFRRAWDALVGHSIVPETVAAVEAWFKSLPERILTALHDLVTTITKPFQDAWDWFTTKLFGDSGLLGTFKDGWQKLKTNVLTNLGALAQGQGLNELDDSTILGKVLNPWIRIINWIDGIFFGDSGLIGKFTSGWKTLLTNVTSNFGALASGNGLAELDDSTVLGKVLNPFIRIINWVDGTLFGDAGLVGKFTSGWTTLKTNFVNNIGTLASGGTLTPLDDTTLLGKVLNPFIAIINWVTTTFFGEGGGIKKAFKDGWTALKTDFAAGIGVAGDAAGFVKNAGTTVLGAILAPFSAVVDWVGTTLFGPAGKEDEKGGLIGKFLWGMGQVKSAIESVIGKDDNSGVRQIFTLLGKAVDTVKTAIDNLANVLGKFSLPPALEKILSILGFGGSPTGSAAPPPQGGSGGAAWEPPIHGGYTVTQGPGDPTSHKNANAVDLAAPEGTPVYPIMAGEATAGFDNDYGNYLDLTLPSGDTFRYGHLKDPGREGQVGLNDALGEIGMTGLTTGPHLHFEHTGGPGERFGDVTDWLAGRAAAEQAGEPHAKGYVFPVEGYQGPVPLHWGTSHKAADLFAPEGTSVFAMTDGNVLWAGSETIGGNNLGLMGDDGNEYYYAHLRDLPLVHQGQRVTAGQLVGYVGETGNAAGAGPHLHIGIGKGPDSIISGTGPDGGGGEGLDDTAFLQAVLGGGGGTYTASAVTSRRPSGPLAALYDYVVNFLRQALGAPAISFTDPQSSAGAATPEQVKGWIESGMSLDHVGQDWLDGLEIVAKYESSDDPSAIQGHLGDVNDYNGSGPDNRARGLMQVIPPTFAAYHLPGHDDIFNPVDNVAAAIRYIQDRYGHVDNLPGVKSVRAGGPYEGYAKGLWSVPFDGFAAVLHQNEMVVPANFAEKLRQAVANAPLGDLTAQLKVALPQVAQAPVVVGGGTVEQHNHYHLHVDGTAKATAPDDNRRMLQRMAFVGGGTFRGNG